MNFSFPLNVYLQRLFTFRKKYIVFMPWWRIPLAARLQNLTTIHIHEYTDSRPAFYTRIYIRMDRLQTMETLYQKKRVRVIFFAWRLLMHEKHGVFPEMLMFFNSFKWRTMSILQFFVLVERFEEERNFRSFYLKILPQNGCDCPKVWLYKIHENHAGGRKPWFFFRFFNVCTLIRHYVIINK